MQIETKTKQICLPHSSLDFHLTGKQPIDSMKLIKPRALEFGHKIGIFTPSWPANVHIREKYLHGLNELKRIGFGYVEGRVTAQQFNQGYRTASAKDRAEEFMELINNPEVSCLMATIGGANSSSLIPYLDFDKIRKSQKIICGYSDVTSLHLAILKYSRLSTFYGPALVPSFGEYPNIQEDSLKSFLNLSMNKTNDKREIAPPARWSNQFIDASLPGWQNTPREYMENTGWKALSNGYASGPLVIANLETLMTASGTPYFPDLEGKILIIEETQGIYSKVECNYTHLLLMGVFDQIKGLIISKPGMLDAEGCTLSHAELIQEIIQERNYPIIYNFDCGHTFPMLTFAQGMDISIEAKNELVKVTLDESVVI